MEARIVMLGSAFDVRGGVSAMAAVCERQGLFRRWRVEYVATHCDGSAARKLARAALAWLRVARLLAARRVRLLHVHLNSDASFWRKAMFVVPARALGVPCVLHVHCGDFGTFVRERCRAPARRFARGLFEQARAVVALSPAAAAELQALFPRARLHVLPNPVSIPPDAAPLTQGAPTVLFLGRLAEAKGAFDLLRAWPRVVERHPSARLVMAGAGELARARALASHLGVAGSVDFPGWIDAPGKARRLREAWVLALPSHHEALPMAVLEALAAGVPVVAARVGGIPEAVRDGVDGVLVAPRDIEGLGRALAQLLADRDLRLALGRSARARAHECFADEVVVPAIERLWSAHAPECRAGAPGGGPFGLPDGGAGEQAGSSGPAILVAPGPQHPIAEHRE